MAIIDDEGRIIPDIGYMPKRKKIDFGRSFSDNGTKPWICPRCKRVNAPTTPSCFCKPEDNQQSI